MKTYVRRFQKFIVAVEKLEEKHGITVADSDRDERLERLWMQCLLLLVQNSNLRHRREQAIKAASLDNRLVRPRDGTAIFVPKEVRDKERDELVDVWKNSKRSQVEILRDLRAGASLKQAGVTQTCNMINATLKPPPFHVIPALLGATDSIGGVGSNTCIL